MRSHFPRGRFRASVGGEDTIRLAPLEEVLPKLDDAGGKVCDSAGRSGFCVVDNFFDFCEESGKLSYSCPKRDDDLAAVGEGGGFLDCGS